MAATMFIKRNIGTTETFSGMSVCYARNFTIDILPGKQDFPWNKGEIGSLSRQSLYNSLHLRT